ncbi:MAG: DUF4381 domain-containing protein [Gammaproteobacteria bacterium]|nr:DUF4381 domain-containing protein [Gammaproteobacteria bacterium]
MDPSIGLLLRDIRGLDPAPWQLPAPGWLLLLGGTLLLAGFVVWWWKYRRGRSAWQIDGYRQLHALRKRLNKKDEAKKLVADFSELLRRIAMARHGRDSCAGLQGEAWLKWLQTHDPMAFKWQEAAQVLLTLPYAPPGTPIETARLHELLDAATMWVIVNG